ncbi:hypothetical protein [Flavobacterium sp.]|uniref:hypothetical protein n=1 Tax=Flavobacterium sp. TaxID=239 RepID=UPI00404882AF
MKSIPIDKLNTVLILISFGLAYIFPFELFIIVYAILGPLHYLTEINWIQEKKYFLNDKKWIYIILFFSIIIAIPSITNLSIFSSFQDYSILKILKYVLPKYTNHLFFISIVVAFSFLFIKKRNIQLVLIIIGILVAYFSHQISSYQMIIGVLLPTIIHVYLFTLLFMWYGNLKEKNNINSFNILLLLSIPIILLFINIDNSSYQFSETIKSIFTTNNFHVLNNSISKMISNKHESNFFFYEILDLKIQMFISFAYTYHYLNWFSKTSIIGWHKKITHKKSAYILLTWIIAVSIYFYNYSLGLSLLLFLSILHVLMEFPLNLLCVKSILNHYIKKDHTK